MRTVNLNQVTSESGRNRLFARSGERFDVLAERQWRRELGLPALPLMRDWPLQGVVVGTVTAA